MPEKPAILMTLEDVKSSTYDLSTSYYLAPNGFFEGTIVFLLSEHGSTFLTGSDKLEAIYMPDIYDQDDNKKFASWTISSQENESEQEETSMNDTESETEATENQSSTDNTTDMGDRDATISEQIDATIGELVDQKFAAYDIELQVAEQSIDGECSRITEQANELGDH